jgi:hypothetical protein
MNIRNRIKEFRTVTPDEVAPRVGGRVLYYGLEPADHPARVNRGNQKVMVALGQVAFLLDDELTVYALDDVHNFVYFVGDFGGSVLDGGV